MYWKSCPMLKGIVESSVKESHSRWDLAGLLVRLSFLCLNFYLFWSFISGTSWDNNEALHGRRNILGHEANVHQAGTTTHQRTHQPSSSAYAHIRCPVQAIPLTTTCQEMKYTIDIMSGFYSPLHPVYSNWNSTEHSNSYLVSCKRPDQGHVVKLCAAAWLLALKWCCIIWHSSWVSIASCWAAVRLK